MSRKRAKISLTTKLACALAEIQFRRGDPIPYEQLKLMTPAEFVSLFHWDHNILHTWGGSDEFWNITPLLILKHRDKTRKDQTILKKVRKAEKRRRGKGRPKKQWPSRPFPKRIDRELRVR